MSTFDSTKNALPEIIKEIKEGKIQLPDFQRGWVWDDNHVRSLLVSIARSFPVGAVMLLETGGQVRFQVRPIENVLFGGPVPSPEKLILDGQQRLTSLTQVLALDTPVRTFDDKKREIERYYYIDIKLSLDATRIDEAIISVDVNRKKMGIFGRDVIFDLSTPELECKQLMFPCSQIMNSDAWEESLQLYAPNEFGTYMKFRKQVLSAFRSYLLPLIVLDKDTSKEAVCLVFEKVNTGGVSLTVFELITASFAAEGYNLRDDWYGSKVRGVEGRSIRIKKETLLTTIENTDFIQAITLIQTYECHQRDISAGKTGKMAAAVSAKRVSMLALELADYKRLVDEVEKGFKLASKFLRKECFYTSRDLPYRTQIIPLAAILTILKERWLEPRIYEKLSRWFWCGVLGELYGGAVETRIANDIEDVLAWIDDDTRMPRTVSEAAFQPYRLTTLRSRNSAAYKGLSVLVLREGAQDFFWRAGIQELDQNEVCLDIHHIFPKDWCNKKGINHRVYDSIVNKTPISYKANRMIGGNAPSVYLHDLQTHKQVQLVDDAMNSILASHLIDPTCLRNDDFDSFMKMRSIALIALVEKAMGKVVHIDGTEIEADSDDDAEESEA